MPDARDDVTGAPGRHLSSRLLTAGRPSVSKIRSWYCLLERAGPASERGLDRPPVAEPAHHGVEDRRQEDAEQGHADHASEDRRPEGAPHLGPGPLGDHQWEYAEDERK